MQPVFRIALHTVHRSRPPLQASSAICLPKAIARLQRISTRLSSTATKPIEDDPSPSTEKLPSISPLPSFPPRPKGTPLTITTRDIEQYVQPLYVRGWALASILPNGNGIAVLRKRFDFTSEEEMQTFLTKLKEYEEKKKHHAQTKIFEDQDHQAVLINTWTHVARKPDEDDGTKTQGVTAHDIRLAYALEWLFENALAASGKEYRPRLRPETDRPATVEELDGYNRVVDTNV